MEGDRGLYPQFIRPDILKEGQLYIDLAKVAEYLVGCHNAISSRLALPSLHSLASSPSFGFVRIEPCVISLTKVDTESHAECNRDQDKLNRSSASVCIGWQGAGDILLE